MSKYWSSQPLHTLIIEILQKKQGSTTDAELYKELLEANEDIGQGEMNEALMKLEVDGLVHVYSLTRNKNRIELVKD
jgi:Fe2+ or Zn2+ uptake regulation protein